MYAGRIKVDCADYVLGTGCLRVRWKKIYSCNNQ